MSSSNSILSCAMKKLSPHFLGALSNNMAGFILVSWYRDAPTFPLKSKSSRNTFGSLTSVSTMTLQLLTSIWTMSFSCIACTCRSKSARARHFVVVVRTWYNVPFVIFSEMYTSYNVNLPKPIPVVKHSIKLHLKRIDASGSDTGRLPPASRFPPLSLGG